MDDLLQNNELQASDAVGGAIPVTLLTGFLGSGKTSVLNHVLRHPGFADTAVIVNEFGKVGIDHLLIEQAVEDAVLLKNGCLCCTIRGDIVDTLADLISRRVRGELPPFRRVVIETTGLADPTAIAELFADLDPSLWYLRAIVATADGELVEAQLGTQPEVREQLAHADIILLTKMDLIEDREADKAEEAIRVFNAGAPIRRITGGVAQPEDLMPPARVIVAPVEIRGREPTAAHVNLRYRHYAAIRSTVVTASKPVHPAGLAHWLDALLSLRGSDVLRLKGIVMLAGIEHPLLVQAVEHALQPPVWLPRRPKAPTATQIVVIGRHLSPVGLQASFDASQR